MTAEDIQRLNFYERQFLRPRDFQDEQAYHIEMRRRHLIAHHTWGIVVGLEPLHDAAADTWSVTPGLAVDGYGREIVVFSAEPLDMDEIRSQIAGTVQRLKIWLQYVVEKAGRPAPGYEVCNQSGQFIRLRETFRLIYQNDPPGTPLRTPPPQPYDVLSDDLDANAPPWPVRLGNILWDPATQSITGFEREERVYVGNVTSEILAPNGSILIRDRATVTPLPAPGINQPAGVSVKVEGPLRVERDVRARADVRVDGKVGVGLGNQPIDTPLQVAGGTDAKLQNGSGTLVLGTVDAKNLVADSHSVMARDNQGTSPLELQAEGGDLLVHKDKVVIKDGGNVGIGTTAPAQSLHVMGGCIRLENGGKMLDLRADGSEVDLHSQTNHLFIQSTGPPNRNNVVINPFPNNGNVGVGIGGPTVKLHVRDSKAGDAHLTENHVALVENGSTSPNADVLALKVGINTPTDANNFITFFGGNTAVGRIEGNNAGGVTFGTTGADFAECLPRLDANEVIEPSDIVGVFAGRVTRNTDGADHVAGISNSPIVLGNVPAPEQRHLHHAVAFVGQVRVKVNGAVNAGDFIIPSGLNDGIGMAVRAGAKASQSQVVGRAWKSSTEPGVKLIRVAVGVGRNPADEHLPAQLLAMQRELDELKEQLRALAPQPAKASV